MEKDREYPRIRVSERELLRGMTERPLVRFMHTRTELGRRVDHFYSSLSEESVVIPSTSPPTPFPFATRPSCYSSSSSSEITAELQTLNLNSSLPGCEDEEQLMTKLRNSEVIDQDEGIAGCLAIQHRAVKRPRFASELVSGEAQQGKYRKVMIRAAFGGCSKHSFSMSTPQPG
ncbi:hypothetical protein FF1_012650 [Malus domestica]